MILAESLTSIESVRTATGFPSFCDWISVGSPVGLYRTMPLLEKIPEGVKGLYIVAIQDPAGNIVPIYGGKCSAKGEGIRRRIRHEFEYKQNEGRGEGECKKLNGPSHVHCALARRGFPTPSYFVTYLVAPPRIRSSLILKMEKAMLARVDFLANTVDNGCRRLDVLETIFPSAAEDYDNDDAPTLRAKLVKKDRVIKELLEALEREKAKSVRVRRRAAL